MDLCEHAIWLDHGEIKKIGATHHVYWAYEQYLNQKRKERLAREKQEREAQQAREQEPQQES